MLRNVTKLILTSFLLVQVTYGTTEPEKASTDKRYSPRQIDTTRCTSYPPLFAIQTNTLDPVDIVRDAWKGYLTKCSEPWGMLPGLKPTYRFWFDNRVLPWPEVKHHVVDGFDNNSRNVGAHAMLREMLGDEKNHDPIEAGQIGYLVTITDPEGGLPYTPDRLPRHCALGHGELAKNVILLYEQTHQPWLKDWAGKMLNTLRRYAHVGHLENVGMVAEYYQGGIGGQGGFNVGEAPVSERPQDPSLEGWQHLYLGWNAWAFSKWYELTGDTESLDFAVALANRLLNSADGEGNDGSFWPDGSFGNPRGLAGSIHGHGHTHCLPGLVHLGGQLLKVNRKEDAFRFIKQAEKSFEFFYDRTRNPDAGSLTGWIPEFLSVTGGEAWKDRHGDCEGCTMGDVVQVAAMFGAVSRLDSSLSYLVNYYDRAEQIFRGQVVESIFKVTPEYLAIVKKNLSRQVKKNRPDASSEDIAKEVEKRYQEAIVTAQRMEGRVLGLCGFPDWVNNLPWDGDPSLPRINMMGCCADATIRAAHAIWSETVTGEASETRVNMALNRISPLVDVVSCLPHRGEVNIKVKTSKKVLVRVPHWTQKAQTKVYVDKQAVPLEWQGEYVVFNKVKPTQQLTVTYPLRIAEVKEVIKGVEFVEYTEKWRGNTIVDISPPGKWIPMFQRPELDTEKMP